MENLLPIIVHALPAPRQRLTWLVRSDFGESLSFSGKKKAVDYATTLCRTMAASYKQPVTLRVWDAAGTYADEIVRLEFSR